MPKRRADFHKKLIGDHVLRPETLMMSYGYDPQLSEGSVKSPIFQTSTFVFKTAEEGKAFFELAYGLREKRPREEPGLIYSRINNPDLEILEDRLTLPPAQNPDPQAIIRLLEERGIEYTTWEGWIKLDAHELALGEEWSAGADASGVVRERVKVVPREDMIEISRG